MFSFVIFQKLLFYNVSIEKPPIKRLKNINFPHKLLFYDKLSIEKISKGFKRYARTYKIDLNDSLVQLESSKSCIKDMFKELDKN